MLQHGEIRQRLDAPVLDLAECEREPPNRRDCADRLERVADALGELGYTCAEASDGPMPPV